MEEEGEENISDDGRISHDEHEALAMKQFTRTIGISPDPATQLVMDRTATRKRFFRGGVVSSVLWRKWSF